MKKTIFLFGLSLLVLPLMNSSVSAEDFFFDNFSSSKLSKEWKVEEGSWKIDKGTLVNEDGGLVTLTFPFEEYIFSCRIMMEDYNWNDPWAGIGVYQDEESHYAFSVTPEYRSFWYFYPQGEAKVGSGQDFGLKKGEFHTIKVIYADSILSLYWDDKLFKKVATIPPFIGKIALFNHALYYYGKPLKKGQFQRTYFDDVKITKYVSSKEEKVLFKDEFTNPSLWNVSGIKNEERVKRVKGQAFLISDEKYKEHPSCALSYNFTTEREDSVLITRKLPDISVTKNSRIKLSISGNKGRQRLFLVLKEKSGEKHFVDLGKIKWRGWKEVSLSLAPYFIPSENVSKYIKKPKVISITHWGGNDNQILDFPLTEITIGVSDIFDKFEGKGVIYLGELKIVE